MVKPNPHKRFSQKKFTKTLIALAELPITEFSKLYPQLWHNPVNDSSLRISFVGFKMLTTDFQLKFYQFESEKPLVNRHLLILERFFPSPYFILNGKKFIVFEEQEATMLTLRDGDISSYLEDLGKVSNH